MGYGDALMATGEVRILRKKNPDAKFIIGDGKRSYWNEMFDNNPYIIRGGEAHKYNNIRWIKNYEHNRPYRLYGDKLPKDNYNWNLNHNAKRGEIFFSKQEIDFGKKIINQIKEKTYRKKIIFIEPNVKIRRGYENRDWGTNNWQAVVNKLKENFVFVQTTYEDKKRLENCINLDGVNFRSAVALLSMCDFFIGTEGGMHHAAAATLRKGVVIFGGFITPKITGYDSHNNIYIDINGSPCGSKLHCKHCEECMKLITPDLICKKIEENI